LGGEGEKASVIVQTANWLTPGKAAGSGG
jgi:hypothetical protein